MAARPMDLNQRRYLLFLFLNPQETAVRLLLKNKSKEIF
jgi:hypothetical protein